MQRNWIVKAMNLFAGSANAVYDCALELSLCVLTESDVAVISWGEWSHFRTSALNQAEFKLYEQIQIYEW
jgi:hypothetical protein